MVASCLVPLSPDQVVQVQVLAGDTVLCFLGKTLNSHSASLSTQVYKRVAANLMLGVNLQWTSILSREE